MCVINCLSECIFVVESDADLIIVLVLL